MYRNTKFLNKELISNDINDLLLMNINKRIDA